MEIQHQMPAPGPSENSGMTQLIGFVAPIVLRSENCTPQAHSAARPVSALLSRPAAPWSTVNRKSSGRSEQWHSDRHHVPLLSMCDFGGPLGAQHFA